MNGNIIKIITLLVALLPSTYLVADDSMPCAHPLSDDWSTLFSEDLSNAIYQSGVWSMEGNVLTASSDGMISTSKVYDNFILDLEFKFGPSANSGVVVYCTDIRNWIPNSVEVQLADDHSKKFSEAPLRQWCGAIFGHKAATRQKVVKNPGEWNRMTVSCEDHFITVVLNGELVNTFDMRAWTSAETNPDGSPIPPWLSRPKADLPTYGHIGLQGKHGDADIAFRNVRIKELSSQSPKSKN